MELTLIEPAGRSVLFVCPAHGRLTLAGICYRQLADMRDVLRRRGVDAQVVVVSNDENLELAADNGFETLIWENWIGGRLNEGYSYAAREGYDYVCAVGNDSWLHPDRFRWLPDRESMLCTRNYTTVLADGSSQEWLKLAYPGGVGSRVIPIHWLERVNYRPLHEQQMSGCDTETLMAICRHVERAPNLVYTDLHPYEVVGFQSETQVTDWRRYSEMYLHERQQAFYGLQDYFPRELVEDVRDFYAAVAA